MTPETVRVEKRKWDGSVAAIESVELIEASPRATVWRVPAGTERQRPRAGEVEITARDEVWIAVEGEWWVLATHRAGDGTVDELILHAATPFTPMEGGVIRWVDLDLDFEVRGDDVALEDEAQFHDHARTMAYPDDVVRGAWSGISTMAARYTTREWPFDGFIEAHLA